MKTLSELIDDVEDGVKRELEALLDNPHYGDQLRQISEGWIPTRDIELAECLASDIGLGEPRDIGGLPENPTVFQTISHAIGERLFEAAYKKLDEEKKEYEDFVSDMDNEGYTLEKAAAGYTILKEGEPVKVLPLVKSEYQAWRWLEGQDVV